MIYVDTSALLKRYIPEANSDSFDAYFVAHAPVAISRLTLVEVRSGLARKRREGALSAKQERAAMDEVRIDIQDGALHVQPGADAHFIGAQHLIDRLGHLPLRTLDALHLAIAEVEQVDELATADDVMRSAAAAMGLRVVYFG